MQGTNIFAALDKKAKSKPDKESSKKKASSDDKPKEKKPSTAELEKAIFAQPLSSSNWADDSEEEDEYEQEQKQQIDDGWSRVPASPCDWAMCS